LDGEKNIKLGDFGLATRRKRDGRGGGGGAPKSPTKGILFSQHSEGNTATTNDAVADRISQLKEQLIHLNSNDLRQQNPLHSNTNEHNALDDSLTIGIGTALYRAPEQELANSSGVSTVPYNQKADMYSLGIILFEMCHPKFGTQMERFTTIKKIREEHLFPEFMKENSFTCKELLPIVHWLTNKDPKDRPSANELLNSNLFPSKFDVIDSKYIEELNEAIHKPNSLLSYKILLTLFQKMKYLKEYESSSQFLKEILWNNLSFYLRSFQKDQKLMSYRLLKDNVTSRLVNNPSKATSAAIGTRGKSLIVNSLLYLNALKKNLREVFELHGGIEYSNQYLELKTSASEFAYYNPDQLNQKNSLYGSSEYLDHSGQVILMPNNLITPFARIAAYLNITVSQRYAFEKIFYSPATSVPSDKLMNFASASTSTTAPEVLNEAIYDFIVPDSSIMHSIMAEYEIISVAKAFLRTYSSLLSTYSLRIGHSMLTDAIIGIICLDIHVNKRHTIASGSLNTETAVAGNKSKILANVSTTSTSVNLADIQQKLKKILFYCNEIQNEKELDDFIAEQKLPSYQFEKIHIFVETYFSEARKCRNEHIDPLFLLYCIEKVSFRLSFSFYHG
jgi:serine/threonine protein kinase